MNKVIMIGRLTRDPEVRYSQSGQAVCKYSLAVNRSYKREGEPDADFVNCIAFGKNGEFAGKYLRKATQIAIVGELRTGSYTNKEGQKVYTTDIIVNEHYFCGPKQESGYAPANQQGYGTAQPTYGGGYAPANQTPAQQPYQPYGQQPYYGQQQSIQGYGQGDLYGNPYANASCDPNAGFTPVAVDEGGDLPF